MAKAAKSPRIGVQVRSLRNQAGITQAQLAESVNVAPETMSRIERGKLTPSTALVTRLATAIGVSPGALFEATSVVPKNPTLRPVERRLLHEVHDLPDELIDDLIRGVRLLLGVGRNAPETPRKKRT
jgi:transcriptional regulator with XRE-family HTH domain